MSLGRAYTRLVAGLATALLALAGAAPASAWWNPDWTRRVKLTFSNGGQAENLLNFPVSVVLNSGRISYANTQNAGQDIRFVDADDTTLLDHEIEKWDELGNSYVWVRIPQVDMSSNTDFIWMYYGNPSIGDGQNPTALWDADFKLVHHLKETAGVHVDSTSNPNDSVVVDVAAQGSAAGQINGADSFSTVGCLPSAATCDNIDIADNATLDVGAAESLTVEAWIRTPTAGAFQHIAVKEAPGGVGTGFDFLVWSSNQLRFGVTNSALVPTSVNIMGGMVADNAWHYVVGRWTRSTSTADIFVDGVGVGTVTNAVYAASPMSNTQPFRIGERGDADAGGFNFNGTIDEVRFSKAAAPRSNAWIAAQYLSMTDAYIGYGAPATSGGDVYYSIGTSIADLKTGAPTISITNGTATLSVAQTGYVGVGDRIQYAGGPVFIKAVLSPTVFVVHTSTGLIPPNAGAVAVTSIMRAFNTIAAAVSGSTDINHLNTSDLVAGAPGGYTLTWVCYNDGPFNVAATTTISGYNTNSTYYITLTVAGASQVVNGFRHRHNGTAASGAVIEAGSIGGGAAVLVVGQAFTRVEWLEIDGNSFVSQHGIYVNGAGDSSVLRYLIVHDIGANDVVNCANGTNMCSGVVVAGGADFVQIRNCFIYDYGQDGIDSGGSAVSIANTTLFRTKQSGEGLQVTGGITTAENVLSMGNVDDFCAQGPCNPGFLTCDNCMSSDASADDFGGTGNLINKVAANQFRWITGGVDLHLKTGADALNAGKDLSVNFTDDIDGQTRSGSWDIGGDEFSVSGAQMQVKSGKYTGDGVNDRFIYVGFQPDVVFIKRDADDYYEVVSTSAMGPDQTKSLEDGGALAPYANGIKSFTVDGFTLGTHPDVNGSPPNATYHWIAFKAAPGELKVGSYTGDGVSGHVITGVGFQPDFVITLPVAGGAGGVPWMRSSTMVGNEVFTSDVTGPTTERILGMEPDGFRVGNDASVNNNLAIYYYIAWNQVAGRTAVGKYTGTGGGASNHDEAGFAPEWVLIKRNDNSRPWVHKPASTGFSVDATNYLAGYTPPSPAPGQDINLLRPLGFQVNNGPRVNTAATTYHWIAFGPHAPTTNYRSIGTAPDLTNQGTITVTAGSTTVSKTGGLGWKAFPQNRGRGDRLTVGTNHYMILSVVSDDMLILASPAVASYTGNTYTIARQFTTLQGWEDCVSRSGATPCKRPADIQEYFATTSSSLVTDDRSEVGIAYKDTTFTAGVTIDGSTTSATNSIRLTADLGNRHTGVAGTGVKVDGQAQNNAIGMIEILDPYVTVEWLEVTRVCAAPASTGCSSRGGLRVNGVGNVLIQNMLIYGNSDGVCTPGSGTQSYTVRNSMIFKNENDGVLGDSATSVVTVESSTIFGNADAGIDDNNVATIIATNVISMNNSGTKDLDDSVAASRYRNVVTSNGTPASGCIANCWLNHTATDVAQASGNWVVFQSLTPGGENLHLKTSPVNRAVDNGLSLASAFAIDIDSDLRISLWDIGADEFNATTAVTLMSFSAVGLDSAVDLSWETGSELSNLGFHLYRSTSAGGAYERITTSVIPGLGSSPVGASYSYRDLGLTNGVTYYYRLEDIETTGKTKLHGPVQATPQAGSVAPPPSPRPSPAPSPGEGGGNPGARITYGNPAANTLKVTRQGQPWLSSQGQQVTLELVTEGFYAVPQADGSVRIEVPGFEDVSAPGAPSIPSKRAWVEAVAGRQVQLGSVRALEVEAFSGLKPMAAGMPEMVVGADGTVRAGLRKRREGAAYRRGGLYPESLARVVEVAFQGEVKKALMELSPLRWDASTRQLLLAKRMVVRVLFTGVELGEKPLGGSRGRRPVADGRRFTGMSLAQIVTRAKGLYGVSFEDVFGTRPRGIPASKLRLSRQGQAVAFHVEPGNGAFQPGSMLYFVSEGAGSNPYGNEAVYELETVSGGVRMETGTAAPSGSSLSAYWQRGDWEQNKTFQSGLLDAPDLWLWEAVVSPATKSYPFTLSGVAPSSEASSLTAWLQGGSDFEAAPDHHVRVLVNGSLVGEASWDGKLPRRIEADVPAGLLLEGSNQLSLENVADTGAAYSVVFLDRFSLSYPRLLQAEAGVISGTFGQSGSAEVAGLGAAVVVDTTGAQPIWLKGSVATAGGVSFSVAGGHSYVAGAAMRAEVRTPAPSSLRSAQNRADYLLIAPAEFLGAAQPLLDRRQSQGLVTKAVSIEEVYQEFGHGETTPQAVKAFLTYAYQQWQAPSLRYVLLLGDATFDFKDNLKTGRVNRVPPLMVKTSYLWTVSDPGYAAVNGEDALPDVAIGRLSAGSVAEAQVLVAKVLAFEDSGQTLDGSAVLVSDNADVAGPFEADSDEIASMLVDREVEKIYLRDYGSGTRGAIVGAFNRGASLMSYVGHGAVAVWASENVFNNNDVKNLVPQSRQPFLMTMNCLNGYFHGPTLSSLAEELLKADGKGVVGAFAPSGLSVDAAAHLYQKALVGELTSGRHQRLGDAILAAQAAYADSGAFPELLGIYHLLGDPALRIR